LINQVQKTLSDHVTRTAIDEYQTDYGMPTDQDLKVKGNWWVEEQPAGGFLEDISNFAKDIVDKTVNHISKQVNITRSLSEFEENEITDSSKFENVSGEGNIRGVYQWVNKSYRVCSRNLGNRLILEIMLDDPAAHFLKTLKRIFEIDLEPPASPQSLGLESYSDILAEKPATDTDDKGGTHAAAASLYYLDLFEQFGVSNVVPPPQDKVTIGKYIKSRNPVSETVIEVPAGYEAVNATIYVTSFSKPEEGGLTAVVGTEPATFANGKSAPMTLKNVTGDIPVSILCKPKTVGGDQPKIGTGPDPDKNYSPLQGAEEFTTYYVANIEIDCERSPECLHEWQYQAYREICAGYEKQQAAYHAKLQRQKQEITATNPAFLDDIIDNKIVQGCLVLFYSQYLAMTKTGGDALEIGNESDDDTPTQQQIGEPRCFEYCRHSLSWSDLNCQLYLGDSESSDAWEEGQSAVLKEFSPDLRFRNFLRAKRARILVPVKKEFTRSFLYFLGSGQIWPCAESFTPCLESDTEICNMIKREELSSADYDANGDGWYIQVPTSMSVLNDGNELPRYRELP
jgi:hypothetical protein